MAVGTITRRLLALLLFNQALQKVLRLDFHLGAHQHQGGKEEAWDLVKVQMPRLPRDANHVGHSVWHACENMAMELFSFQCQSETWALFRYVFRLRSQWARVSSSGEMSSSWTGLGSMSFLTISFPWAGGDLDRSCLFSSKLPK